MTFRCNALSIQAAHDAEMLDLYTAAHVAAGVSPYLALAPRPLPVALARYTSNSRTMLELTGRMARAARLMGWRVIRGGLS